MTRDEYDIVIIGGGIHGAGAAQAAAAQGYSVLVLEKSAIASGTSSRSSKLIHGGLRYLETAQFALVKECLRERQLLLENAPDLVKLKPFLIPVYQTTKRQPALLRIGLSLYGVLTGFRREARFRTIAKSAWNALDGLATGQLKTVFQYWDAQTDDILLTKAVMRSAQSLEADLEMPAQFLSAVLEDDGCIVEFDVDGIVSQVRAKFIVNAAGPWANNVLTKITPKQNAYPVELVQGTHIIVEGNLAHGIYYVEAPRDGRAVFVMPWYDKIMVGTTEKIFEGNPDQVAPSEEEILYLLETLSHYFPAYKHLTPATITRAFAGLRVLPKGTGSAFTRPRDTVLHFNHVKKPHMVTLYGGKLTAYRATSERVIKEIAAYLPKRKPRADTRTLKLAKG